MEKLERILIALVVLAMVLTFGFLSLSSLFEGNFDCFAAYGLITLIVLALVGAAKEEI